jgi:zinc D-Ala-D-Ala carboxypeptidase
MNHAAQAEMGKQLKLVSGFRSYERQQEIYDEYVRQFGQEVTDTFSARPGYSEHQTGLAADLSGVAYV